MKTIFQVNGNRDLVRETDAEEATDAEDSGDEETLVMPKRKGRSLRLYGNVPLKSKKGSGVIFVGRHLNPKKETRRQLLGTLSMLKAG